MDNMYEKHEEQYEQTAVAAENRENGPRPPAQSPAKSKEWLKNLDIAAIVEHMESEDIAELIRSLPEEVILRLDFAEITEHMESEDIVKLLKSLPPEQLRRLDISALIEHLDSKSILAFMKSILN